MNCAKCGLDLPDNTRQCPKCGAINEFAQAPAAAPKKKNPMLIVLIGLAVVGLLALAVYAMSNRNIASAPGGVERNDTNVATAPPGQPSSGNLVTAPPAKPTQTTTPPGVAKPKPPQEVVEYLDYVKKVEEHRQMLLKDTSAALVLAVGGQEKSYEAILDAIDKGDSGEVSDPMADMRKELNRQYGNWQATVKYFDQKPAPAECRDFAGSYRAVLASETETIKREVQITSKVDVTKGSSISDGLTAMMGMQKEPDLQANIDKSADDADAKLSALVSTYDMQKPFDVPREKSGGSILGF